VIRAETRAGVARIRIDRLEKRNAMTARMYGQLVEALVTAEASGEVRAILLHGTAECFTAGNDLNDFLQAPPDGEGSPVRRLLEVLPDLKKPIVAAVGGPAIGIGTTLLLHCDLVYAAANARFQLPFVPLGIVPEFGSTLLLPLMAGHQRAAEVLLLGQPFTAERARELGIVTAVVSPETVLSEGEKAAAALAALPPESIRLTKRLMRSGLEGPVRARILEEGRLLLERLRSPEAMEAISAFLQKRKPDFPAATDGRAGEPRS
jgi:enoyl-CoA hydratase/carnithine racemase